MKEIGVVIVTYNRLDKLKIALNCFANQTCSPAYVLVIDNASTDGTRAFLEEWKMEKAPFLKIVITMNENTGGSGGFYRGLSEAQALEADWIWVSDDDAYPAADALEKAEEYLAVNKDDLRYIAALCGAVYNEGRLDCAHRRNIVVKGYKVQNYRSVPSDYAKESFTINAFSYVGAILSRQKMLEAGLPMKDYFIWYDDTEHSLRMSKTGKIVCLPNIVIHHDVPGGQNILNWKTYYGLRNEWDMWHRHFPGYVFWIDILRTMYKIFSRKIFRRKLEETALIEAAMKDALAGKFGIHEVYRPGWKPKEL